MKKILLFAFGFLFLSFPILEAKAQSLMQNGETPKDLIISLERNFNCFDLSGYMSGKCRDYSLKINADGDVILRLEETRKRKAKNVKTKVNQKEIEQLIDVFEKANFFQLQNEYTNGEICKVRATEQSTEIISIEINGKKKQVEHYLGCYIDEKEITTSLLNLGNKIDEVVKTRRWIGEKTY